MSPQQQEQPVTRKRKKEPKLEFNPGAVFDAKEAKAEDLDLDLESAHYVAQKGQGGDRRV